jgi:transposase
LLVLEHRPEAIDAWGQTLRTRVNGQPVAVCLELNQGPLVSALRADACRVRFPINPCTLAKYREAFPPSPAKDAPTAAALQVELRLKHRDQLTPLSPQSPTMRAWAQLVEHRRRLVGDQVRLTNRLPSALKHYFPPVLQWFQDKDTAILGDFLSHRPTRKAAQLARRATLAHFFQAHYGRSADVIQTRSEAIKSAVALPTAAGVITPKARLGQALVAQLRVTLPAIADFDTAIAPRAQEHPDFPVLDALPGAGAVFAPRLLVAFGEQRERYASAEELQP